MKQLIKLSDHFGYRRLIRFTLPSILMMILTSIYGVVDGFFISNYGGKTSFAAINFIMPFLMVVGAMGFMFGTGGSAVIAKTMGEGKHQKAQGIFSMLIYAVFLCGVAIAALSIIFLRPVAEFLGAEGAMLEECMIYGRIILAALPFLMLQYAFSSLVVTAEKPKLGLVVTIVAGLTNMIGDFLLIAVFQLSVAGAALATALGQILGGIVPLVYFIRKNSSLLRLGKPDWNRRTFLHVCTNGSSELMSNISMSLVGMIYNAQLLKYAGEDGVAAYGTIMYVNFVFLAIFIGYSTGAAPVISYHFGAGNTEELHGLLKKSSVIILISSTVMFFVSERLSAPLSGIFVGYDWTLLELTVHAFDIYAFSFLFAGISIFGSAFFTALNDGLTSALIAFLRTLVFQTSAVLLLPLFLKLDGIWYASVAAELLAVTVTLIFLAQKRTKFQY